MPQGLEKGEKSGASLTAGGSALIALGSNLDFQGGGPAALLDAALGQMGQRGLTIRAVSRFFDTQAFPVGSGPNFVNAAALVDTPHDATQLLTLLHDIEGSFGRERTRRWGARTLDLDLLALDAQVLPNAQTHAYWRLLPAQAQMQQTPDCPIVPHPRLAERAFVLVPLMDVAPDWVHPVTGDSVRAMHDALPQADRAQVVAL